MCPSMLSVHLPLFLRPFCHPSFHISLLKHYFFPLYPTCTCPSISNPPLPYIFLSLSILSSPSHHLVSLSPSAAALFNHLSILHTFHIFRWPCLVHVYLSYPSHASLSPWLAPPFIYPSLLHPHLSFTSLPPSLLQSHIITASTQDTTATHTHTQPQNHT